MKQDWNKIKIYGLPLTVFLPVFLLVTAAMRLDFLPGGMPGAMLLLMAYGGLFSFIGDRLPVIRTYLGGGTIFCIFGAAFMSHLKLFPENVTEQVSTFLNETGFIELFIVALIVGSILSMNRALLLKSTLRFLPVAFCAMGAGIAAVALAGYLLGYPLEETVMYIAVPMMSGGMGAGVIPLSDMYASALGTDAASVISRLIPASAIGNVAAILMAGILFRVGERFPGISGGGTLMRSDSKDMEEAPHRAPDLVLMGQGLLVSLAFFLAGGLLHRLIPAIHTYAWMIVLTAGVKAAGVVPAGLEEASWQWSRFVLKTWTSAILIGIGIALIDLNAVAGVLTPSYLFLIFIITAAVTLGAALGGYLVGFYPIESAITAGLCTINMGGSGNIAILSASRRMELLAFAQLATRICGSLVLVVTNVLLRVFYGA